jgi:predicted YcjX-like family ATPase
VRLSDFNDATAGALRSAGERLSDLITPSLRLGVTGLARSGKTVFITALVRNLLAGGRLPYFSAMAEARIVRAYLEPQPDDRVARFPYEAHLEGLSRDPPQWPESTRRVSQLRVTIDYVPAGMVRRAFMPGRLHVDIVDYPGEWLLDLPLLDLDFGTWSERALADARRRERSPAAKAWLTFLSQLPAGGPADEQVALEGAALFTRYLEEARVPDPALAAPGPGRFLLPGDVEGSPLLTFFPFPSSAAQPNGALGAMLARRFESYKTHIVKPFFRDHFARLDRQIVLIDALSAINAGADAIRDLQTTLETILACFKPAAHTWLSRMLAARRLDRLLFAATKADHLHHASHDRLEAMLRMVTGRAIARAEFAGADVKVVALAALRATREAEARSGWQRLPCIVGVPLPGERVGRKTFDGSTEAAVFPGDLPDDPAVLLAGYPPDSIQVPRFRPPRLDLAGNAEAPAWPHIRLDRAMEFLLGDRLA